MAVNFGLIAGNPFYLSTLGLAIIGWIIIFSGAVAAQQRGILWFYITYEFLLIVGIIISIATDSLKYYRLVFIGFMSASIVWLSTTVNNFLFGNPSSEELVVAAGAIFLSIVTFVWLITFGADDGSSVANYINSLSITAKSRDIHPNNSNNPFPTGVAINSGGAISLVPVVSPNADYAYKAKALYDYQASPEDQNELSFTKGEILDIVDNKGKWWQARKVDGTIGIAPSNYLEII